MRTDPLIILLAEDDPDDCYLIGEALDESNLNHNLYIVGDGEELLDYLNSRDKYSEPDKWPRPELILLDLNMPRKNGIAALAEIKEDPKLRRIPIIALTTSQAEEDLRRTYDLGVSGFITKPLTFRGLVAAMKSLGSYWEGTVKLPSE